MNDMQSSVAVFSHVGCWSTWVIKDGNPLPLSPTYLGRAAMERSLWQSIHRSPFGCFLLQCVRLIRLLPGWEKGEEGSAVIYGSHSVCTLLLFAPFHSLFLDFFRDIIISFRAKRAFLFLVPWSHFSGPHLWMFIVSLGTLTATCVLSGLTLIAFGQGRLLNAHTNGRDSLSDVCLDNSEATPCFTPTLQEPQSQ